jgi:hypothetical protein
VGRRAESQPDAPTSQATISQVPVTARTGPVPGGRDESARGAAVVPAADESVLAGMVFDARLRPDGQTELACYPGYLIASG